MLRTATRWAPRRITTASKLLPRGASGVQSQQRPPFPHQHQADPLQPPAAPRRTERSSVQQPPAAPLWSEGAPARGAKVCAPRAPARSPFRTVRTSSSGASSLHHAAAFYDRRQADALYAELSAMPEIQFTSYVIDGERRRSPRAMLWAAEDQSLEYRFSENHNPGLRAHALTPTLRKIQRDVEAATGERFNAVLLNLYCSGSEFSDWHCDDDPWLGEEDFSVPSLSLGAERSFAVRPTADRTQVSCLRLEHGSLSLMSGGFQREFEHSVPKQPEEEQGEKNPQLFASRVNLTWRYVVPQLSHLHNMKAR